MTKPNLETLIAQWEGGDVIDTRQFVRMLLDERKQQLELNRKVISLIKDYKFCGEQNNDGVLEALEILQR